MSGITGRTTAVPACRSALSWIQRSELHPGCSDLRAQVGESFEQSFDLFWWQTSTLQAGCLAFILHSSLSETELSVLLTLSTVFFLKKGRKSLQTTEPRSRKTLSSGPQRSSHMPSDEINYWKLQSKASPDDWLNYGRSSAFLCWLNQS